MKIIVVNGYPGTGKTLFAEYCDEILKEKNAGYQILTTSVIEPVKKVCRCLGWDGEKDQSGRKFLADIKDAMDRYNNFTYRNIDNLATMSQYDFIFIDARSSYDLDYAVLNHNAATVFIQQNKTERKEYYSNHADSEVEEYNYDYYIGNNGTKEDFYLVVQQFLETILEERE